MEQDFGKGAIITPTLKKMPTLPRGTVPFDWDKGFSTRELKTKDQNGSYSCGGQAVSYKGEADTGIPKSARFPYCQAYSSGGGSGEDALLKVIVKEGLCDESVFKSYEYGLPPSESFMEKSDDINETVLANAVKWQGVPVYVYLDFESLAQAIRDNNGVILGIYGKNNGTWSSKFPKKPDSIPGSWTHWVFAGKAQIINGKKYIGIKNSWGDIGENGWQYLGEDYLPFIWSAWTFIKGNGYKFNKDMRLLQANEDIFALQARLGIRPTGYFGPITLAKVIGYQRAHGIPATGYVGPLTRASLNTA